MDVPLAPFKPEFPDAKSLSIQVLAAEHDSLAVIPMQVEFCSAKRKSQAPPRH
jgi:hypothetical protein